MSITTASATPAPTAPRRSYPALAWAPIALLVWAAAYGSPRVHWALGNAPSSPRCRKTW